MPRPGERETHSALAAAPFYRASDDVPTNWIEKPAQFVDLNAPILGANLRFPIADPRAYEGSSTESDVTQALSLINGHVERNIVRNSNSSIYGIMGKAKTKAMRPVRMDSFRNWRISCRR